MPPSARVSWNADSRHAFGPCIAVLAGVLIVIGALMFVQPVFGLAFAGALLFLGSLLVLPDVVWLYLFLVSLFLAQGTSFGFVRNVRIPDLVALAIVIRWLFARFAKGTIVKTALPFRIPLIWLCFANVLSILGARDKLLAISGVMQSAEYLLLYFALTYFVMEYAGHLSALRTLFVIIMFVQAGLGIFQTLNGVEQPDGAILFRAQGTLDQSLSTYIGITIAGFVVCYLTAKNLWARAGFLVAIGSMLCLLLLTMVRGSLVWLCCALLICVWRYSRKVGLALGIAILAAGFGLFILSIASSAEHSSPVSRLLSLAYLFQGEQTKYGNWTVLLRFELWREGIMMFFTHPIFGIGAKNFFLHITDYATPLLWKYRETLGEGYGVLSPHNQYIDVLAETGLVGIAGLLWLSIRTIKSALRLCKAPKEAPIYNSGLILLCCFSFFWLSGLSAEFFFGYTGLLFVALLSWASFEETSILRHSRPDSIGPH